MDATSGDPTSGDPTSGDPSERQLAAELEHLVTLLRHGQRSDRKANLNRALALARRLDATPEAVAHILAAAKAAGLPARYLAHQAIKMGLATRKTATATAPKFGHRFVTRP